MSLPRPTHGAAAVIFDKEGRVLLIKENYDRRRWSLPGGALEEGEAPEEAVVRETMEETGLHVAVEHLVGSYTLENGFTAWAFRCAIIAGTPEVPRTGEIEQVVWHDPRELPAPRSNILHYAVPDALLDRRGVARTDLPPVS